MNTKLIRIVAPHFVAGIVFNEWGHIEQCAPILYWMKKKGWTLSAIRKYCDYKKYKMEGCAER